MKHTAHEKATTQAFSLHRQTGITGAMALGLDRKPSNWRMKMNRNTLSLSCLAVALVTSGCATPTPILDQSFGDSVRTVRAMQTVNPDAGYNEDTVAGLDGVAAKETMGRYQDSFKVPPPATNVINIGGAISGGN